MNDHKEYQEWLADLKVGDEVAINVARWGPPRYNIRKIERMTASQIVLSTTVRYRKDNGRPVGEKWGTRIEPVTDEVRRANWRAKAQAKVEGVEWREVSDDVLRAVLAALEPEG